MCLFLPIHALLYFTVFIKILRIFSIFSTIPTLYVIKQRVLIYVVINRSLPIFSNCEFVYLREIELVYEYNYSRLKDEMLIKNA
jgi:hypothetical protein